MSRVGALLDFLASVPGVVAIVILIATIVAGRNWIWPRWMLFGLAIYAASLDKLGTPGNYWFPHMGPIEFLCVNGRTIAILILCVCGIVSISDPYRGKFRIPKLLIPILCLQLLMLCKIASSGGGVSRILEVVVTYAAITVVVSLGVRRWLSFEDTFFFPALTLGFALSLFVFIGELELWLSPDSVLLSSRFMGTTGNPQHAAVYLAISLLAPIYVLSRAKMNSFFLNAYAVVLALLTSHLLLMTGSRTGILIAAVVFITYGRRRIFVASTICVVIGACLFLINQDKDAQESANRAISATDTRSGVWAAQWEEFQQNPVFGRDLKNGVLIIRENSWLAVLENTGVVGLTLLLFLFSAAASIAVKLLASQHLKPLDVDFCLAGLFSILIGSVFEGFLLAVLSMPILFIALLAVCTDINVLRKLSVR